MLKNQIYKYLLYLLFTCFLLVNFFSFLALYYLTKDLPYLESAYIENKINSIKRFEVHQYPHPYFGYTRNYLTGATNESLLLDDDLFWNVYETDDFNISIHPTILILGGSVAAHLSDNSSDRSKDSFFGSQAFARALRERYPSANFRILNAAYGGYKQPQQFMKLVYLDLLGTKFDIVINVAGVNESALVVLENQKDGEPYTFPRSYNSQINSYVNARCLSNFTAERGIHFVPVIELYNYVQQDLCRREFLNPKNPQVVAHSAQRDDDIKSIWVRSSNMMARYLQRRDTVFLDVLQPNQYISMSKIFSTEEINNYMKHDGFKQAISTYYSQFSAGSLDHPHIVDLRYLFQSRTETLYRDSCCHFNDLGMYLLSLGIIDSSPSTFQLLH